MDGALPGSEGCPLLSERSISDLPELNTAIRAYSVSQAKPRPGARGA